VDTKLFAGSAQDFEAARKISTLHPAITLVVGLAGGKLHPANSLGQDPSGATL
jgi:hypothetical protein